LDQPLPLFEGAILGRATQLDLGGEPWLVWDILGLNLVVGPGTCRSVPVVAACDRGDVLCLVIGYRP
jgi:hypothetical protein